jgi:t-SNARE complex subunit (syntaxin)
MALYQRLSASVQEQEQLVRGVEESWLEMESDMATPAEVEAFVKRIREARKVAFLRREREERWDEARVGGWR